jgi:hypothetical protein
MKWLAVYAAVLLTACASLGGLGGGSASKTDGSEAGISARGTYDGKATLTGSPWTGDGGKDISLAVLAPQALSGAPGHLPIYIQGLLNSNLKRHSAMTLIDRQNLDQIIAEQKLSASGIYSDKDMVNIGNLANAQYVLVGSIQKLSGENYALQLSVSEASTGVQKAAFTGNGTLAQLEGSGSLINRASAELLAQLGVTLTEAGRLSLSGGNTFMARAENAYAKGVAAQATGDQLEALFSYAQAASFDPGQLEALARLGTLSSTISGGSISERIRNDQQARDQWIDVFKETARYYNEHPPYELIFDPSLEQEGETDYGKRTAVLLMRVGLVPSKAGFDALNALLEGLEQTGRRGTWGFGGWPMEELNPKENGTRLFSGKNATSFALEVLLLNDKQKQVGKGSVTLSATPGFATGDTSVRPPAECFDLIRFRDVKTEELTPELTIVINSVNGIPSKTLNSAGYMRIAPGDLAANVAKWQREQEAAKQAALSKAEAEAAAKRAAADAAGAIGNFFTYAPGFILSIPSSVFTSFNSNYGWELSAYPEIGVKTGPFMLSVFGGGGRALLEDEWSPGIYSFGGNVGFYISSGYWNAFGYVWGVFINGGVGMAGPSLADNSALYPFVRGSLGLGFGESPFYNKLLTIFVDYNFADNGYRAGVLIDSLVIAMLLTGIIQ